MRSTTAAVVLVLSSVALLFGLTAASASAAVPAHTEVVMQASAFPVGLTGFSSLVVLLGLAGLAVGLTRLGRRSMAAKRAAAQVKQEEPARTSA
ncbi:MAG TPA: hypothetical protein VGM75_13250 [Pseudonocardiaceae bacterium]|jgi:hypothetical protein